MAEEIKKEDGAPEEKNEEKKHVAYRLLKPFDELPEGKVINLPEAVGEALIEEGNAELADAEDIQNEGEEEEIPEPVLNSVEKLTAKVEKAAAAKIAKSISGQKVEKSVILPAQPKQPIYKSNGQYILDMFRANVRGDKNALNRVLAMQEEVRKSDPSLQAVYKAPLGINETTAAQGGYLVNPQFSKDVYVIPHNQLDLVGLCESIPATSNILNQRFVNESSLANGSIFGGLNMVNVAEGASFTSSLPAWSNVQFQLQKFVVFVYYTIEELQDASYPIERELDEYVQKAFLYGLNTQLVQGSTLEGLLNAPSAITVTHDSNDTAYHTTPNTNLTYADLVNIWARVYPDSKASPGGVWLYHPGLDGALNSLAFTFGGATPAFGLTWNAQEGREGEGGGPLAPYKMFGKPMYPHWACSAPGTAGDIMYVDFGTVRAYKKDFRVEVSREFQFGTDQVAVRYVARIDAKTVFRNAVTGPTGTTTFGPVVTRSAAGT